MNKTIVVYKSKYGSTKTYAEWIAKDLNCDLVPRSKANLKQLVNYDTIVYGGSLYTRGISGFSLIRKNYKKLKDKRIIVFTVGLSPAYPEALVDIQKHNFPESMRNSIHHIHLRGRFEFKRLSFVHKIAMRMLRAKILAKNPKKLTQDEKAMLASYDRPVDFVQRKAIQPVLSSARAAAPVVISKAPPKTTPKAVPKGMNQSTPSKKAK